MHRTYLILAIALVAVMTISTAAYAAADNCDILCQIGRFLFGQPTGMTTGHALSYYSCSGDCPYTISTSLSLPPQKPEKNVVQTTHSPIQPSGLPLIMPADSAAKATEQKLQKSQPTSLRGSTERLFAIESSEFLSEWHSPTVPPSKMDDVYEAGIGLVDERTTDSSGAATFGVSAKNQYLIIAKYTWADSINTMQTTYAGKYITPDEFEGNAASVKITAVKRLTQSIAPPPIPDAVQELTNGKGKK